MIEFTERQYYHLFLMNRLILKDKSELNVSCDCIDTSCDFEKRVRVYFNLLKSHRDNPSTFYDFCEMMINREELCFTHNFLYSFLKDVNEDVMMDNLFDKKEDMTNEDYLRRCDILMTVKKFRNMMEKKN
jgi:hypothetical protein